MGGQGGIVSSNAHENTAVLSGGWVSVAGMTTKIRYAPNQNNTDNNRIERLGQVEQIATDAYDPASGTPRQWVYWLLHQAEPGEYSRDDRDDLLSRAEEMATAHDAETAARTINGRTRVTYDRMHYESGSNTRTRQPFFEALESFIADRVGSSDSLNEWLGDSTPDDGTAASWAESYRQFLEDAA